MENRISVSHMQISLGVCTSEEIWWSVYIPTPLYHLDIKGEKDFQGYPSDQIYYQRLYLHFPVGSNSTFSKTSNPLSITNHYFFFLSNCKRARRLNTLVSRPGKVLSLRSNVDEKSQDFLRERKCLMVWRGYTLLHRVGG